MTTLALVLVQVVLLVHLLVADLLWIAVVIFAADAMTQRRKDAK